MFVQISLLSPSLDTIFSSLCVSFATYDLFQDSHDDVSQTLGIETVFTYCRAKAPNKLKCRDLVINSRKIKTQLMEVFGCLVLLAHLKLYVLLVFVNNQDPYIPH